MNYVVLLCVLLSCWLMTSCLAVPCNDLLDKDGKRVAYAGRLSDKPVKIPVEYKESHREMRGVWLATVWNIDLPQQTKAKAFKDEFKERVKALSKLHFNALFVQVRSMNDAFYPSRLNPWSRFLAGKEGVGIASFDPLKFMIEECHARGMEFHAWLNPYRVVGETTETKEDYLKSLDDLNFAKKHPELVLAAPRGKHARLLFLNPGEPAVVKHVEETVQEILDNYEVDAIHFDDYFYPYSAMGELDQETFQKHGKGKTLEDWRRDNVTGLIETLGKAIRKHNKKKDRKVQFGISPFGIWANRKSHKDGSLTLGNQSYVRQYADTRKWLQEGLVDYLVPQLYWEFGNDVAAYACLVDWWARQAQKSKARLYIGMAPYRLGGNGWEDVMELANQLRYNRKHKVIKGQVFFSARDVLKPRNKTMEKGLDYIWKNYWTKQVKTPKMKKR